MAQIYTFYTEKQLYQTHFLPNSDEEILSLAFCFG